MGSEMCIRDSDEGLQLSWSTFIGDSAEDGLAATAFDLAGRLYACLLYTSDAADERSSVDLGGRRIIKKKNNDYNTGVHDVENDRDCIV